MATLGIGNFEIDGGTLIMDVPKEGSQYGQGISSGFPSFLDIIKCINGKAVPEGMGPGRIEVHGPHHFSRLPEADIPDCLMKDVTHLVIPEGFLSLSDNEIRIVIMGSKTVTDREIVFDLLYDRFRNGD